MIVIQFNPPALLRSILHDSDGELTPINIGKIVRELQSVERLGVKWVSINYMLSDKVNQIPKVQVRGMTHRGTVSGSIHEFKDVRSLVLPTRSFAEAVRRFVK